MDDLPPSLILEILNRLPDSAALARCRVSSKTLNALSHEVRSVNLYCSLARYHKSRSAETSSQVTPFKVILKTVIKNSLALDSVSIGVEKSLGQISYEFDDLEDESDDFYLTDASFAGEWLPGIGGGLTSLSISDFWFHSCWRQSKILALISSCCHNLVDLELKNAWLSVDGLARMCSLKCLTLECIRLDDEDLSKVNYNFPHLEVLNFIGVGGLSEPKIHLLHLKTCHWTVSNAPVSLSIFAPNLLKLKLKCVRPKSLTIEAPLLSDFHLSLEDARGLEVKELPCLIKVQIHSPRLDSLITAFASARTIKELTLDKLQHGKSVESAKFCLDALFELFPNLSFLKLSPEAWSEAEICFRAGPSEGKIGMRDLIQIHSDLKTHEIELNLPFILSILEKCPNFDNMSLLIHRDTDSCFIGNDLSGCATGFPRVRWRWQLWKEGSREAWTNGVQVMESN